MSIYVVCLEISNPGNLGAIARAMKNFDLSKLVLIEPKCDYKSKEAMDRAVHAKDILKKAKIKKPDYLKKFDYLIGTTAILGTDYNIPRNPINPEQLSEKLKEIDLKKINIGILIGREGIGLKNNEIEMCDILVTIPASKKYPTLNISHASSIIFYELFKTKKEKSNIHIQFADKKDLEIVNKYFIKILNKLDFRTKEKKDTQKKVWKRIFGKALLTKREAFSVMGLFRKLLKYNRGSK